MEYVYSRVINTVDDIEFDQYGNIRHYYVLKSHPDTLFVK